ncbi:MAG: cell division protein ZapA [Vicinamibacterales bacterium]
MEEPTTRVITVEIHGQRYPVRTTLDAAYVNQLASYVDAKMRTAAHEAPTGDSLRIAVLAALNIADEYFHRNSEGGATREELRRRTETLEQIVDDALAMAGSPGQNRLQPGP